jgi:hypothetical protein
VALVVKQTKRVEHPTEPGTWFDLRIPLSAGDLELMRDGRRMGMVSVDLMAAVIQAWSYEQPVTVESVKSLDLDSFAFLVGEIQDASGIREDSEKKVSSSSSPVSSVPVEADSPQSLGI